MSDTDPFLRPFRLQRVRALHLLACVLNFYRSAVTTPILREEIPRACLHWTPGGGRESRSGERPNRLAQIVHNLVAKACEEEGPPSDRVEGTGKVLSRVSTSPTAPEMTSLEKALFDQLVEEFLSADSSFFAGWALRRTGLEEGGDDHTRGVLLVKGPTTEKARTASLLPRGFLS